jgi:L-lysine exporter family protein LysE/ArgO
LADPALIAPFGAGLLLGAGAIVAIGPQNAFVLRQGLLRQHVFLLAATCAASDVVLIAAGVGGLGVLVRGHAAWLTALTLVGVGFLAAYGAMSLRRAFRTEVLLPSAADPMSAASAVATVLAFTVLNPHVYLDTIVLVGGLSARYPTPGNIAFGAGAGAASIIWFFALGYGARLLAPLFARPVAWRVLDVFVTAVMWGIAASLAAEVWRNLA